MPVQTFQQALLGSSVSSQRAAIEQFWLVHESAEPNQDRRTSLVMKRSQSLTATRFAWEQLSIQERLVLFSVLKGPREGIPLDTLLKKTKLEIPELSTALARLEQLLLLKEEMRSQPIPTRRRSRILFGAEEQIQQEEVLHVFSYPDLSETLTAVGREQFVLGADRSQFPLTRMIREIPQSTLYLIAQHHHIDLSSTYGVTSQRSLIVEELSQPDTVLPTVSRLQEKIQKVFHWLVERGGNATIQAVRQFVDTNDDAILLALVQMLKEYALVFTTLSQAGEHILFIPQEMVKPLRDYSSRPQRDETDSSLLPLPAPPVTRMESVTVLLFDIAVAIGAIYQMTIEPTKDGNIPKRIVAKLRPLLQGAPRPGEQHDDDYPDRLFEMIKALKLLQTSRSGEGGDKPLYQPGAALPDWATMESISQGRRVLEWWTRTSSWKDGWEHTFGQWSSSLNPLGARKVLMKYLQQCTPGRWYTVSGLLETLWKEEPFALLNSRNVSSPTPPPNPSHSQRTAWYKREALIYRGSLRTLYELGILDLGQRSVCVDTDPISSADIFSLTTFGHAIIEHTTARHTKIARERVVVVQPSFEVIVLAFDPPSLYALLPFTQVTHISQVSRLKMTRESVLRSVTWGLSSEQIVEHLQAISKTEIPQNVAYSVREWARGYKAITFSQVILLEVTEGGEDLAQALDRNPQLAPFGLRFLGPRILAAPNHVHLTNLRRILKDLGIATNVGGDIVVRKNTSRTQ